MVEGFLYGGNTAKLFDFFLLKILDQGHVVKLLKLASFLIVLLLLGYPLLLPFLPDSFFQPGKLLLFENGFMPDNRVVGMLILVHLHLQGKLFCEFDGNLNLLGLLKFMGQLLQHLVALFVFLAQSRFFFFLIAKFFVQSQLFLPQSHLNPLPYS